MKRELRDCKLEDRECLIMRLTACSNIKHGGNRVLERMDMNGDAIKNSQYLKSKPNRNNERTITHGELILMNGQEIFFLRMESNKS